MVELEDSEPVGFGLWIDGNMPSSYGTLPYVTSRRYLQRSGLRRNILHKYNLYHVGWKACASKDEVFEAALSGLVENTLKQGSENDISDLSLYILKPLDDHKAGKQPLLKGPRPSSKRRRSTYRQIAFVGNSYAANNMRKTGILIKDILNFSSAPIRDYPSSKKFCEQAIELLRFTKVFRDSAYCRNYLGKIGFEVREFHWRSDYGPFSYYHCP